MITLEDIRNGCIVFKTPDDIHNNYGLEIYNEYLCWMIDRFDEFCHEWFCHIKTDNDIDLKWFHQGRDKTWSYFEFWNGEQYQDMILEKAEWFSKEFGINLVIE